ncbi:MAG: hypothetical protein ACHQF3_12165 [Alphaproteobacteria bacterium]
MAVLVTQQVFKQDLQGKRQASDVADAGALQRIQAIDFEGIVGGSQSGAGGERVFRAGAHTGTGSPWERSSVQM